MIFTNQLIHEKSPYLLQHAHNPVNWRPWGDEAFAAAAAEDKPLFLSVGYATCHWCHVMERESFENPETAALLNDTFVCIKVDREERPDIDAVYMAACHLLTGRGGWPLTVLLTPDRKPFFAATYLPPGSRFGQIGVLDLCRQIKSLWISDRTKTLNAAAEVSAQLQKSFTYLQSETLDTSPAEAAYAELCGRYDAEFGGFETAPKFPSPHRLLFLLQRFERSGDAKALEMAETTLTAMRTGGIWDHVGFGFHRYSTDRQWLLPHFEKMLYDQAMTALAYIQAFRLTQRPLYAETFEEIFDYVLRDMTSEAGAFFTAEDADSEGREGRFYVWSAAEFRDVASDMPHWETILHVVSGGNFHDEASGEPSMSNILHTGKPLAWWSRRLNIPETDLTRQWTSLRKRLFEIRDRRPHPLKDDKILTDWNGLMIAALANAAGLLHRMDYERAAVQAAEFVLTYLADADGNLYHRYRDGQAAVSGLADDYAFMIYGLLALHSATDNSRWLKEAVRLQVLLNEKFLDRAPGGYFMTEDTRELPARPKELYDGAMPSANSVSLVNLNTLYLQTGESRWRNQAMQLACAFGGTTAAQPAAFTFFLTGMDMLSAGSMNTSGR
jgi:uncharacterized protein YyaL (SSP411 family)